MRQLCALSPTELFCLRPSMNLDIFCKKNWPRATRHSHT
jgi:hypothetical protein